MSFKKSLLPSLLLATGMFAGACDHTAQVSPVQVSTEETPSTLSRSYRTVMPNTITMDSFAQIVEKVKAAHPKENNEFLKAQILEEVQKYKASAIGRMNIQSVRFESLELSDPELVVLMERMDLLLPSIKAYAMARAQTQATFPNAESLTDNEVDAYRHAVWNISLGYFAIQGGMNIDLEKGLGWAKTFTDAHEAGHPNSSLSTAMDLHNNRVGRIILRDSYPYSNLLQLFSDLKNHTGKQLVRNEAEIAAADEKTLVYLY